jgi:MFS transporter, SP family, arabinose:H+ symporter
MHRFPLVAAKWGALPSFFFAVMTAMQFVVVLFLYPETRGVVLEQMEANITAS